MAASPNGKTTAALAAPFSLDPAMIQQILDHAKPLGHCEAAAESEPGIWLRLLRPGPAPCGRSTSW